MSNTNREHVCNIAQAGFSALADQAAELRDRLRTAGAPQEVISRTDRILFAARVGENNAAEDLLRDRAAAACADMAETK